MRRKYSNINLDEIVKVEKVKKKRATINSSLRAAKVKEVLMPLELIEQIFDSSKRFGFETEEEAEYREQKEQYNKEVIKQVKKIRFTKKQSKILRMIFVEGKSLTEIAKMLKKTPQGILRIKKEAIAKVKKRVKYLFKYAQ